MRKRKTNIENYFKYIRAEIVIAIFAFLIIISMLLIDGNYGKNSNYNNDDEIIKFILEDAKSKFTSANVLEIINVYKEDDVNYDVVVKAVYYYTKGEEFCVRREHIRYAYPRRGFANLPPEKILDRCTPCNDCKLNFKEEALLLSYDYLTSNGLNKTLNISEFYPYVEGKDGGENWTVVWKKKDSPMDKIILEVKKEGEVVKVK